MIQRLSPWQRLWGMFAVVFLATTCALIATMWPLHDDALVADLRAPECREWRAMPDSNGPNYFPEPGQPCRALRLFRYERHFTLRSESAYDAYLLRTGAGIALRGLAVWAGLSLLIYAAGAYTGRMVTALRQRSEKRAG